MKFLSFPLILASIVSFSPLMAESPQDNPAIKPENRMNEEWWAKRWERNLATAKEGKAKLVFLGDSITQGWEGGGKKIWEEKWAPYAAANFGYSGDRTEHVLWRIENGEFDGLEPKVVVIMIGTNNIGHDKSTPAQTAVGVKEIVKQLQAKFANVKILLLGIFPRAAGPDDGARKAVVEATAGFKDAADGVKVHFIDLADKFLNPDGTLPKEIMPDLLHLNEKGYQIWADSIEAKVKELMGE